MPKQFHCYLVQKIESVFHPAKLACGANYPVGWVQMPHSVSGGGDSDGWGGAQRAIEDRKEAELSSHPGACGPSTSRSPPERRLFNLTGFFPPLSIVLFSS